MDVVVSGRGFVINMWNTMICCSDPFKKKGNSKAKNLRYEFTANKLCGYSNSVNGFESSTDVRPQQASCQLDIVYRLWRRKLVPITGLPTVYKSSTGRDHVRLKLDCMYGNPTQVREWVSHPTSKFRKERSLGIIWNKSLTCTALECVQLIMCKFGLGCRIWQNIWLAKYSHVNQFRVHLKL